MIAVTQSRLIVVVDVTAQSERRAAAAFAQPDIGFPGWLMQPPDFIEN